MQNEIDPASALDTASGSGNSIDCGSNGIEPNVDVDLDGSNEEEYEY